MPECPNCGAAVEAGAPVCDSCGLSLGDDLSGEEGRGDAGQGDGRRGGNTRQGQPRQGRPQGGQARGGQPRQGQQQGGQPRQGQPQQGRGRAPQQQGQPRQGQYRQPQQGQYRQPRDDEVVAGLNRRQVLGIGGAGVAVVAVGGFVLLGGGAGGPAGTAEAFVNELNSGNGEAAANLLHPDSQLGENQVTQLATLFGQVDVSVQGTEVTEQADGRAEVEIQASAQGQTNTLRMEMRQANGEWRVFSFSGV